jgi:L-aminopeptidase/D-esterase-like protein
MRAQVTYRLSITAVLLFACVRVGTGQEPAPFGLTAVDGVKVGHYTLTDRPTGCTVILTEEGAVAGVDVRGAAPGTRETALLDPSNTVQQIHAVVLSGGSAFGLDAASGVMQYLDERNIGFKVGVINVPIVPAAVLFDLAVGNNPTVRPTAQCGYAAAAAATTGPIAEGSVGAGAGAIVGKSAGLERAMKGGLGTASVTLLNGLTVAAIVAVNAYGDIVEPDTGTTIAGVRTPNGRGLADVRLLLRSGTDRPVAAGANTTIGIVATNGALTKAQATRVAMMAHDGYARAIIPAHTPVDGDTIFALSTGTHAGAVNLGQIGALAADVMAEAIVRAVETATGLPGLPAVRDLER